MGLNLKFPVLSDFSKYGFYYKILISYLYILKG